MPKVKEPATNECMVCAHAIEVYAIGHCDHVICFKCSTKMRLLCGENYCPVCRKELKKVIFSPSKSSFTNLNSKKLIMDPQFKISVYFTEEEIQEKFLKMLEHRCPLCPDRPPDQSFLDTKTHLRKDHSMFYCEICLEHNHNFTTEYKIYSRKDLATHKRIGDADDTSHKGHPLCSFCDKRFLDNDKLYHHLRTNHYYCHLCEHLNSNEFYNNYPDLRKHFKTAHLLCEIGNCVNEEFTCVFGSEIDLKAHCAVVHKDNKTKQQQKQDRQINLDFQYTRRHPTNSGRERTQNNRHRTAAAFEDSNSLELATALKLSLQDSVASAVHTAPVADNIIKHKSDKIKTTQEPAQPTTTDILNKSNFPILPEASTTSQAKAEPRPVTASAGEREQKFATAAAAPLWTPKSNYPIQGASSNDFPALCDSSSSSSSIKPFLQPQTFKKPAKQAPSKSKPQNVQWNSKVLPSSTALMNEEDFPSLGPAVRPGAPWLSQQSVIKKKPTKTVSQKKISIKQKTNFPNSKQKTRLDNNSNMEDGFSTISQNFTASQKSALNKRMHDFNLSSEPTQFEPSSNVTLIQQQPPCRPAVKQRSFVKAEQDFPALFPSSDAHWTPLETSVLQSNNPAIQHINDSSSTHQTNGTNLNLGNIFDFPSI